MYLYTTLREFTVILRNASDDNLEANNVFRLQSVCMFISLFANSEQHTLNYLLIFLFTASSFFDYIYTNLADTNRSDLDDWDKSHPHKEDHTM